MPETMQSEIASPTAKEAERPKETRKEPNRRWFPFRFDLAEQDQFKALTPRKRVILLDIYYRLGEHLGLYEKGYRQIPYYVEADAKWADRLRVGIKTFRDARYELGRDISGRSKNCGLGWFDYRPGHGDCNGKMYRTEYHEAKFARVRRGEGNRCATIDRHTWGVLIAGLKKKQERLEHADLATFTALAYLWERCGGPGKGRVLFYIAEIEPLTGIAVETFMNSLERIATLGLFTSQAGRERKKWTVEVADWRPIPDGRTLADVSLQAL
jgi:hypothetical protein